MPRIGLFIKFTARPGKRESLVEVLLRAPVQDAPGCELYYVSTPDLEADAVWITEVWSSQEAHDAILTSPGVNATMVAVTPLITGRPETIRTVLVGGKGFPSRGRPPTADRTGPTA